VLQKEQPPVREDPVQENMKMLQGQGSKAFMDQDHDAHIQVHMNFTNGLNEEALMQMGAIMQAHLAEHFSMKYFNEMNRQMGGQLPPPGSFSPEQPLDPQTELMISQAAASIPQIEIMPPEEDEEDDFERIQARLDDEHERDMVRKDEAAMAEIERKELAAMSKQQQEDFMIRRKVVREERANEAKIERDNKLAAAHVKSHHKTAR